MVARLPKPPKHVFPISAIVSMDPAAVGTCGLSVRLTASLQNPKRGKLRAPDFTFEGCVFNSSMHDDLTTFLAKSCKEDTRVILVVEDAMYGARTTARHLGRSIGCIEGVLNDVNLAEPFNTKYVAPQHWRPVSLPVEAGTNRTIARGREELKQAAIDTVATLYGIDVGPDLAEAILIGDYAVLSRHDWWRGGAPVSKPNATKKGHKAA